MAEEKKMSKGLSSALAALEKRFGAKVVQLMTDTNTSVDTISSGRADLDAALGGGYACGKIIEIFAESGCGKTGLCLEAVREVQKEGGQVAYIDYEHALNPEYAEQVGVDVDALLMSQPDDFEQGAEIIRTLINTEEIDLIIIDSVAAMTPRAELDGESGETKMGLQARLMSQMLRMITGIASNVGCTIIFINQLRDSMAMYGSPKTTTGGKALKFYATQRLEIKNKGQLKEGEKVIGFKQHISVIKNKIAPPFKVIENDIVFGIGVDAITGLIEACTFEGIFEKAGAYYRYKGTNLAQGVAKLRVVLEDNPDLVEELQQELKNLKN